MPRALVRRPGPRLADGIVTHIERTPVDLTRAVDQWERYVAALEAHGWVITEVAPADDCPDAVFVEDAVVVFDDLALITRPGAEARRGETAGAEDAARSVGLDVVRLAGPATLDGGDVLKVDGGPGRRVVFVGVGGRTDADAVAQLDGVLSPRGWQVRGVPVSRVLHLKSAVTALPDGTIVGHPDLVDDVSLFDRFLAVPEHDGSHVVLLGGDRLLMSSAAPATADLFASMGYVPVCVDIGEFEKLEGCVTCLSVRIRH